MWNHVDQGLNVCSALTGRFLTPRPPRTSTSILFFTVALPVYILTKSTQGFLFFTFLPTLIFYLFDDSILMGMKWYLIQFWLAFPWWSVILNTFSCTFWSSVCLLGRNKRWVWWCVHPLFWLTVCLSACKFSNTTYLQSLEKVSVLLSSHHSSQGSQVSYSVGPILRCPEVHGGNQEPYLTLLLLATQDPGVFLPLNSIWILET